MRIANRVDENDTVMEERLKILLTADSINTTLGINDPPSEPMDTLSDEEIFKILRPSEPLGLLTFAPIEIPPTYKALWYINSRNLVQKGRNFTHFTTGFSG